MTLRRSDIGQFVSRLVRQVTQQNESILNNELRCTPTVEKATLGQCQIAHQG